MECYCEQTHAWSFDQALDELAQAPDRLDAAIGNAAEEDLAHSPGPGRGSIRERVAHLKDAELIVSLQYRLILVEDVPDLLAFDPDRWADHLSYSKQELSAAVGLFGSLRADNLRLLRGLKPPYRKHEGRHPEHGAITLEALVIHTAAQTAHHLEQIRECRSS